MVIRYNDFVKALEKLLIADYDVNVYVQDDETVVYYLPMNRRGIGYLSGDGEYILEGTTKTILKQVKIVYKYIDTLYKNRGMLGGKEAINLANETLRDFRSRVKAIYHAKYDFTRQLNRRK